MFKKHTIILERTVNGRKHRFSLTKFCSGTFDIAMDLYLRASKRGVDIDVFQIMKEQLVKTT